MDAQDSLAHKRRYGQNGQFIHRFSSGNGVGSDDFFNRRILQALVSRTGKTRMRT